MNFSLFKPRKRGELTAGDDVASGPRRRADVARGTSAWMRRGRATAGPREAQVALTCGTRPLTCRFCASLKHKYDGQTKFIKPNSQRQDRIIKYWVSIGSIHKEQG